MKHVSTHFEYLLEKGVNIRGTKMNDLAAFLMNMPEGWLDRSTAPHIEKCQYGCGGTGWFRHDGEYGHPLFGVATVCQCTKDKAAMTNEQRIAEYRNQMSATEQTWTLKNWIGTDQKAKAAATEAVQSLRGIKLFVGDFGRGKSGLLAAICNSCLDRRIEAGYWVTGDLLDHLQASYSPKDMTAFDRELDRICGLRVLALDECFLYKKTEWRENTMRTIFDRRYRYWDSQLTVLGTNPGDMPEDGAILSRLHDTVRSKIVYVEGPDMRPLAKDFVPIPPAETDEDWRMDIADEFARQADESLVFATR